MNTPVSPMRRRLLQGLGASAAAAWAAHAGAVTALPRRDTPRRIVTMNWELTETLLALGAVPAGMSLPDWYARTIVEPPLPAGVVDTGLLYQPNFEVLQWLAPDLMIITPSHASIRPALERIAPTLALGYYMSDPQPYQRLRQETEQLARALSREPNATVLIDATDRTVADAARKAAAVPAGRRGPVIVADAVDDRHLRVYGAGSLFGDVLRAIGVDNAVHPAAAQAPAWTMNTAGFALVSIQRLIDVQQATVLLVGPVAPDVRDGLARNPLWRALAAVRDGRVAELPVIAPYGGLVSMQRFAQSVASALGGMGQRSGDLA